MDLPISFDEFKDQLQEILPGCDFDVDEDTDEVIIHTNRKENPNGDLEEIEKEIDPEDMVLDGEEESLELLEEDNKDD